MSAHGQAGSEARGQREVPVRLGDRSYSIRVGPGLLGRLGRLMDELAGGVAKSGPTLLVTNPTVGRLHGAKAEQALAAAGASRVRRIEIADGEQFKTIDTVEAIYDAALAAGVDRTSLVVALGGGVVGDVAGFAAATLLRGLRLVMVPTTLLAQVDSSVGGKTGVNRREGKNLVGAFHQPALVVADTETLATLPEREYRAGLAEVVKYGMILDAGLFELLERESARVLARDVDLMTDVVARSVAIKGSVVERDEREGGLRRILNFGHTVGHGLEQATDYRRYLHGEAVAIGMVAAARLSSRLGLCDAGVPTRLALLLDKLRLPTELPADVDIARVAGAVGHDKKSVGDEVAFIACSAVGSCREQKLRHADIVAGIGAVAVPAGGAS